MTGPDPLARALEPNAAQRAYLEMAAGTGAKHPGWTVTWDLAGFSARRGLVRLGPASTQGALELLLSSFPRVDAPPAEACTVTWESGGGHLTVTCPHGRQWAYEAFPLGDRPLPHFLHGTPWLMVPGSQWELDDAEGVWVAKVAPVSAEMAGKLYVPSETALPHLG